MKTMGFEEFKNLVKESIIQWLPERFQEATISFQVVTKNNNLRLTGMNIMLPNKNIAPTIYLEGFFEKYQKGEAVEDILEQIAKLQLDQEAEVNFDTACITEYEQCKDKIYPRLISKEWNQNMLENHPHIEMEDLAIIFYIDLNEAEKGSMTVKIHEGLVKNWNITVEELYERAISNLKKDNAGIFRSMNEVLMEMMTADFIDICEGNEEEARKMMESIPTADNVMYVLSNINKIHGASVVLNNEMMERVINTVGETFFVLPSSVHELLIVPAKAHMQVEDLKAMVYEVNSTQVCMEERLSNNVYTYSLKEGLKIA